MWSEIQMKCKINFKRKPIYKSYSPVILAGCSNVESRKTVFPTKNITCIILDAGEAYVLTLVIKSKRHV